MCDFLGGIERVYRSSDAAECGYGMKGDRIFGQVRTEDAKHVALFETARGQACCRPLDRLRQFAVSDRSSGRTFDESRLIAVLVKALQHKASQRHLGDRYLFIWGAKNH